MTDAEIIRRHEEYQVKPTEELLAKKEKDIEDLAI